MDEATAALPISSAGPFVVCLGASAGGLEALERFFRALESPSGAAYVVVVHLSPDFKSLMPDLLDRDTPMPVQSARDGLYIEPDHVYIIPPGSNLRLTEGRLRLEAQNREPGHGLNLPIDLCLQSIARDVGQRCVAAILSGTGSDGSRGISAVKDSGGWALAQDPEQAKFDGMPLSAIQTGLVDWVAPVEDLAVRVQSLIQSQTQREADEATRAAEDEDLKLREESGHLLPVIMGLLSKRGYELSYLRDVMILRRVARRATLLAVANLGQYVERLKRDDREVLSLASDLLVGVTSFFRDKDVFETLRKHVLPRLVQDSREDEPIRVWTAACSTGQEVYTVTMCLLEAIAQSGLRRTLKVYATDVNGESLKHASRGSYTLSEVSDVPNALVGRYFEARGASFSVNPSVRQSVIFAQHNAVTDPPFTRMDLVTCRNLLIYLKPDSRQQLMTNLFQALTPDRGILLLGSAEALGPMAPYVDEIDARARIYRRAGRTPEFVTRRRKIPEPSEIIGVSRDTNRASFLDSRAQAEARMLRQALETSFEGEAQTAALVDRNNRLIEILTDPIRLFTLPKGPPTDDLTRVLPSSFASALWSARNRLGQEEVKQAFSSVMGTDNTDERYELSLRDLGEVEGSTATYLLVVRKRALNPEALEGIGSEDPINDDRVAELGLELARTKASLQETIEELQSTNEEQQSTNEELVAANEELQSTNEELHSLNEELYTVNVEYQRKNDELRVTTADLDNLIRSLDVATLYVDANLYIRRFNDKISRVLVLKELDVGRSLETFAPYVQLDLVALAREIRQEHRPRELEIQDRDGVWLHLNAMPYLSDQGTSDGVVFAFSEMTRVRNAEEASRILGEQLAEAKATLAHAALHMNEVGAAVSDLRTYVETVQKQVEANVPEALSTLRTVDGLLRDLSDLAVVETAPAKMESVDIGPWFDGLVGSFSVAAEAKGILLRSARDAGRRMLPRAAAEVAVRNVLANAVQHGAGAEIPSVDVHATLDGARLRITVSDNGTGMDAEDMARVFETRQGTALRTDLGLPATRLLLRRAGGELEVDSRPGEGARFLVHIPTAPAPDESESGADTQPILLVENDKIDAQMMREVLVDHEILWMPSLREGQQAVKARKFRLIFLDLSLPDGHGMSLLREITQSRNVDTPVVVLSGREGGLIEEALAPMKVVAVLDKNSTSADTIRLWAERTQHLSS